MCSPGAEGPAYTKLNCLHSLLEMEETQWMRVWRWGRLPSAFPDTPGSQIYAVVSALFVLIFFLLKYVWNKARGLYCLLCSPLTYSMQFGTTYLQFGLECISCLLLIQVSCIYFFTWLPISKPIKSNWYRLTYLQGSIVGTEGNKTSSDVQHPYSCLIILLKMLIFRTARWDQDQQN